MADRTFGRGWRRSSFFSVKVSSATAEEAASPRVPRTAEAVEKLDWDDMKMIFATQFASEIAAVTEDGGGLSRERVAA